MSHKNPTKRSQGQGSGPSHDLVDMLLSFVGFILSFLGFVCSRLGQALSQLGRVLSSAGKELSSLRITVKVGKCKDIKYPDSISSRNPWVVLLCAGQKRQTPAISGEGENPNFGTEFEFFGIQQARELRIELHNDSSQGPLIGVGRVDLREVFRKREFRSSVQLYTTGESSAGKVRITIRVFNHRRQSTAAPPFTHPPQHQL